MTEETIIDGVNVRGCEYYKGKCMEYTHYCQIGCKECTDIGTKLCHYKQTEKFKAKIARLEQENKELSFAIEKCLENAGIECDDEEQALRSLPDLGASHYKLLQENETLNYQWQKQSEIGDEWYKVAGKYKVAFEEIKRITEEDRNCMNSELACCRLCDKLDLIKDKINGVLNEA